MDALELAQQIANRLGEIDGVIAVVLGGSRSRGDASPDSDIDLGIYYRPENRPSLEMLQTLSAELDDSGQITATDFGGWGPWINGGGWLTVNGQRVDWVYRDLQKVERVIEDCHAGRITVDVQPGHPYGFYNHIYMGEVFYCQPLFERDDTLAKLKALTVPYPPAMKAALVQSLWQSSFALQTTIKAAARGDVFHVTGSLKHCAGVLVQALFALNERYYINEKGAIKTIETFPLHPDNFAERINGVLGGIGTTSTELYASVERMSELIKAVHVMCNQSLAFGS
jgi:predicted nucleotidyltransferase